MSSINSTTRSSLSAAISDYSFTDGGDIAALLQAVNSSVVSGLTDIVKTSVNAAMLKRQQLNAMLALKEQLPKLSLVTGSTTTVVLGADMTDGNALVEEVAAAGVSLDTSESCYIQVNSGAKHIATPAELSAAQAANLISSTSSPAIETRSATDANKKTTQYTLYKDEGVLTASKADVTQLAESIDIALPAMQLAVQLEDARLQACIQSVQAKLGSSERPQLDGNENSPLSPARLRRAEESRGEDRRTEARKDIVADATRQFEHARDDIHRNSGS